MKADYEQQSQRLSDILVRLTAERAELANGVDQEHPALVAFMKFENIDSLSREILIELIDHIKGLRKRQYQRPLQVCRRAPQDCRIH